jgi:hypothetical protein
MGTGKEGYELAETRHEFPDEMLNIAAAQVRCTLYSMMPQTMSVVSIVDISKLFPAKVRQQSQMNAIISARDPGKFLVFSIIPRVPNQLASRMF